MDWNEFNRELQNRVSDTGTRYILGLIYERLLDISKQTDVAGTVMLAMAQTIKASIEATDVVDDRVKQLSSLIKGRSDGVSVQSVPLNDED
jgi:hypothetical protein